MENIIKKIEALQPKHDLVESYEDEPTYDQGWDRAIGAVVDLLYAKMEWKDEPDEEGHWWLLTPLCNLISLYLLKHKAYEGYIAYTSRGTVLETKKQEGKWQKVIMPIRKPQ